MKTWRWRALAALVLILCMSLAHAADVRAWLDRNSMQLGESVTLNVEVGGGSNNAQPDFSPLRQDFDLLGTQSSTSVNIVNGQTSAKQLWAIGLQPHRAGTITIPALEVAGQRTEPLTLTVTPAAASASGKSGDDLYIEVNAEPKSPYVQQEVLYTVKLYFALNFSDGGMDEPHVDGLDVHKLGQDSYYSAQAGGRNYRVWERRYALTPEKSGSVTLPAIVFRGHAIDPADINSFFSRGRAVTAHSDALTLEVRPRPAASGSDTWLPARSVTLTAQGIDAQTPARVGEPLTLTVHLKAQGLGFEQLPDLKLPAIDGADVYPDKTSTQNRDDGEWLYGERERKFAIVPNRPGTLELPPIAVAWWDTAHDRAELAQVPAVKLDVLPAAGASAAQPGSAASPSKISDNVPRSGSVAPVAAGDDAAWWRRLALIASGLWLVTLAGWIASIAARRGTAPAAAPPRAAPALRSVPNEWSAALARGDWPAAAKSLLAWAKAENSRVNNLGELADTLGDADAAAAVRALDRACYGQAAPDGLAAQLQAKLRKSLPWKKEPGSAETSVLPPLYGTRR